MKGTKGKVAIELGMQGDGAVIRVSDERQRMPGDASSAFQPFDGSRSPTDVSGLALFAARAIAEAHGGSLALDEQTAGTSFVMRVPKGY
jgi:C4-dicarboxylate-specific signal transduction histidine kinase